MSLAPTEGKGHRKYFQIIRNRGIDIFPYMSAIPQVKTFLLLKM